MVVYLVVNIFAIQHDLELFLDSEPFMLNSFKRVEFTKPLNIQHVYFETQVRIDLTRGVG